MFIKLVKINYLTIIYCLNLIYSQKDPQKIIFNQKLITRLCWSLESEYIVYVGEENGELAKINLTNGKTDSIKKFTSCDITAMIINPKRF